MPSPKVMMAPAASPVPAVAAAIAICNDGGLDSIANSGDVRSMATYPGGKAGAGVYQTLINLIPPHPTYIETHLGGGALMCSSLQTSAAKLANIAISGSD